MSSFGARGCNGTPARHENRLVSTDPARDQCVVAGHNRCHDLVVVKVVESAQFNAEGPRTVPACEDHAVGCLLDDAGTTVLALPGREEQFSVVMRRAGRAEPAYSAVS